MRISPFRTGLVFGFAIGIWHLAWAGLVAGGLAQMLLDFVLRLHFLKVAVVVAPFDLATAGMLIAITTAIGFVAGLVVALIWNALQSSSSAGAKANV